jgi:biopolymer transport protein ExbD
MRTTIKQHLLLRPFSGPHLSTFSVLIAALMFFVLLMIWFDTPVATLPGPFVELPTFDSSFATLTPLTTDHGASRAGRIIVLSITRHAQFFLNDRAVMPEQIQTELRRLRKETRDSMICLKIDNALPYRWVIWTSIRLKELGIDRVFLVVRVGERPYERIVQIGFPTWKAPILW